MTAIIIAIAVVVVIIAIITMKAQAEASAIFNPQGVKQHAKYTWHILCHDRVQTTGTHTWNKTNMALAGMFTLLSAVLLHSWFFVANVMRDHGTHVEGMGWMLIALYALGTLGCIAYSLGFGWYAMNRSNSHVLIR
jgi:thiosulfate reductase cytochrome b subunit